MKAFKDALTVKPIRCTGALILGKNLLCLVLTIVPLFYLIYIAIEYSVDVPVWDDWRIVPLLDKSYQGTLTINDFLVAHSYPHRIFFPQLIILFIARLTAYNLSYQFSLNILLGVGIFVLLTAQLRETGKMAIRGSIRWLIPIFGILVFSLSQWNNWFWGWQICILLNILSALIGIYLLGRPNFRWTYFIIAACCGIIAMYSFAYGLLFWPVGLFLISIGGWDKKRKWVSGLLWAIIGLIMIYAYFHYPSSLPQRGEVSWQGSLNFILLNLSTPLVGYAIGWHQLDQKVALYVTGFSFIMLVYLSVVLVRYCRIQIKVISTWLALILYSVGSSFLTSLGRETPMASHYVTVSLIFWIANIVLLYIFAQRLDPVIKSRIKAKIAKCIAGLIIVLIVIMVIHDSYNNAQYFRSRSWYRRRARDKLSTLKFRDLPILGTTLGPTAGSLHILKKHHLSVFRER